MTTTQRVGLTAMATIAIMALLASLVVIPANAQGQFSSVDRVAGDDRMAAAVGVAESAFPEGADTVVLARVDSFPDALSGAPLAALEQAPILFTSRDGLATEVADGIRSLGATRAIMLGGTAALTEEVEQDLIAAGVQTVERIAGTDRYATSRAIADIVLARSGARQAYVALGDHPDPARAWPDAVAISGLAASQGRPVLLTSPAGLPQATSDILSVLDAATLVGGTTSLPAELEQQIASFGLTVDRLAGSSRFETSLAIAERAQESGASAEEVWLVSGSNFSDPLATGPAVAALGQVMLLADGFNWQAQPARQFLVTNEEDVNLVHLVGEEEIFPADVPQDIDALLDDDGAETPPAGDEQAPATTIPADAIRVELGQDIQSTVAANPPGSTFVIAAGIHREQSITPRSGDRFIGEDGAVLAGSRVLDPAGFTQDPSGLWVVDGQTQRTTTSGELGCTDWSAGNNHYAQCGAEQEVYHGEELFADGTRLRHVNSLGEVDEANEWFFDYATDRIVMAAAPSSLGTIETTTTSYAFEGAGTDSVLIENLGIRQYGSRAQIGALNGIGSTNWNVVSVDASYNHGAGIGIGPGMTITHSRVTYNGQIGMGGRGDQPVSLPVTVRYSEIASNTQLGFQHGWEAGGTKFTYTDGMIFEHNWVHDNVSKGVWFDLENRNAVIRNNVVENNTTVGIFYEISYNAVIHDNVVRNNHLSGNMERSFGNILVVSSSDVQVYGNLVLGGGSHEIMGVHQERGPGLTNFDVYDNDVVTDSDWGGGQIGVKDHTSTALPYQDARYYGNRYYTTADESTELFHWRGSQLSSGEWEQLMADDVIRGTSPDSLEVAETSPGGLYGPRPRPAAEEFEAGQARQVPATELPAGGSN